MKVRQISKIMLSVTATAFVAGLNIASAAAMPTAPTSQSETVEALRLSKRPDPQESVFSEEQLMLKLGINEESEPTELIAGEVKETGSDYKGFNFELN